MNLVLFEDNPVHADKIEAALNAWARSAGKTVSIIRHASPVELEKLAPFDCILLDVEMPDKNGMEYAKEIRNRGIRVPIVFISDHVEYSLAGYEVDALRFLSKNDPYFPQKLKECMDQTCYEVENSIRLYYTYKENGVFRSIPMGDVLYFDVYDHVLKVHTIEGTHTPERTTLASLLPNLPEQFVQCSRSDIINILHVTRLSPREATMRNGDKIPITKNYSETAFQRYLKFH